MPRIRNNRVSSRSFVARSVDVDVNPIKQFYTLEESIAFENDNSIRIVYMTEKGIDLHSVFSEDAKFDYALRHGYSWYNIMTNPPKFMQDDSEKKRVCIVNTTEAAVTAHKKAKLAAVNDMHVAAILACVRAIPTSNRTQDTIADRVTEYLYSNKLYDVSFWDSICNILYREGLLPELVVPEPVEPESPPSPLLLSVVEQPAVDSDAETVILDEVEDDQLNQSVGSVGSVESAIEWVSNILSIPDMSWVLLD